MFWAVCRSCAPVVQCIFHFGCAVFRQFFLFASINHAFQIFVLRSGEKQKLKLKSFCVLWELNIVTVYARRRQCWTIAKRKVQKASYSDETFKNLSGLFSIHFFAVDKLCALNMSSIWETAKYIFNHPRSFVIFFSSIMASSISLWLQLRGKCSLISTMWKEKMRKLPKMPNRRD